ncbi:TPA: hypothetical protein NID38_000133 [Pseudomonas aeruginosa]|nr:hypothetical protein [Pseudomonas aeruginosa]
MAKFYLNASNTPPARPPSRPLFNNPAAKHINNRSHCLYRRPAIRAQAMRAWATQEEPAADEDQTEPSE